MSRRELEQQCAKTYASREKAETIETYGVTRFLFDHNNNNVTCCRENPQNKGDDKVGRDNKKTGSCTLTVEDAMGKKAEYYDH